MSTNSSPACANRASLPAPDLWAQRLLTVRAAALLCGAWVLVALVPFRRWRGRLGLADGGGLVPDIDRARWLARRVERAATRLRLPVKCLPRAMALSWLLRREGIAHCVAIAIRPAPMRDGADSLHAWVEAGDEVVLGQLPGPWHVLHRMPG